MWIISEDELENWEEHVQRLLDELERQAKEDTETNAILQSGGSGQQPPSCPPAPPGSADDEDAGNFDTVKSNWLKRQGIDAEALKRDYLGRDGRFYNIAVNSEGRIMLVPVHPGARPNVPTIITIRDAKDLYPRN